jgi:L-alanine-DL-glutamate epimerase-like enolase superfamily enzyme
MQIQWLDTFSMNGGEAGFLVAVRDGSQIGLGEIALLTQLSTTSIVELISACAVILAKADPRNLSAAIDAVSQITDRDAQSGPAVRAGLDMALHDLNGKLRGCAVHTVLGGSYRDTIALSQRVATGSALPQRREDVTALRLQFVREPSRLATSFGKGAASRWLAATLAQTASAVQLDIEASGQFDNPALARTFIEGLLSEHPRLNVGLLQPLNDNDLVGHATLCATLPVPVILDTSVRSPKLMGQIVRMAAADRIMLNVERVGGLRAAMQVVSIAEAGSIGVSAATGARTAVGAAAAMHLAAALHDTFPAQLDLLDRHHPAIANSGLTFERCNVGLGVEPGLGVVLAEDAMSAFRSAA